MSALAATSIAALAVAVPPAVTVIVAPDGAEVDQAERELRGARGHVLEAVSAVAVRHGLERLRSPAGSQFDADAGQHAAGFVGDGAGNGAAGLGEGGRSGRPRQ